ncbi:MAG: hypothetical protein AAGI68_00515 [Planctomycetota bacterium]
MLDITREIDDGGDVVEVVLEEVEGLVEGAVAGGVGLLFAELIDVGDGGGVVDDLLVELRGRRPGGLSVGFEALPVPGVVDGVAVRQLQRPPGRRVVGGFGDASAKGVVAVEGDTWEIGEGRSGTSGGVLLDPDEAVPGVVLGPEPERRVVRSGERRRVALPVVGGGGPVCRERLAVVCLRSCSIIDSRPLFFALPAEDAAATPG